jgi:predicted transcriptional regulator
MQPKERLEQIASDIKGGKPVAPVTVRSFLAWFGAQRRGYYIVHNIRGALRKAGLITRPDFESAYIDSLINFALIPPPGPKKAASAAQNEQVDAVVAAIESTETAAEDPTYRVSKLAAANQKVLSVKPDASIQELITLLMSHDFSQMPVMTTDREVKGIISWKSVGERLGLGVKGDTVKDFMDAYEEVPSSASIFDAIPRVIAHDYVLVRAEDKTISGIITASDLSVQFRTLSEPFLLLSEIENLLRMMIEGRFTVAELRTSADPSDKEREINSVADLAFGEYIRLLENEERWAKFSVSIDRTRFCKDLDKIRRIRNDVMHFDPDGVSPEDLERLRDFARFIKRLVHLLPAKGKRAQ